MQQLKESPGPMSGPVRGSSRWSGGLWRGLKALASQRLVHFLLFGGALYAVAPRPPAPEVVELPGAHLQALVAAQAARQGVSALSPEQIAEVHARALEDEVLYREALRLELDRSDALLRQHLIQKMLLLAEDLGGAGKAPTEAELRGFYEETRARWTVPETLRLMHVFASRREVLEALRPRVLQHEARAPDSVPPLGEAFPVSRDVRAPAARLAMDFGPVFLQALQALPPGEWSAPVASKYGWHLVKVKERSPERPATFEEIRDALVLDYAIARRQRVVSAFVERALQRYSLSVDGVPVEAPKPTGRLGIRAQLSGED